MYAHIANRKEEKSRLNVTTLKCPAWQRMGCMVIDIGEGGGLGSLVLWQVAFLDKEGKSLGISVFQVSTLPFWLPFWGGWVATLQEPPGLFGWCCAWHGSSKPRLPDLRFPALLSPAAAGQLFEKRERERERVSPSFWQRKGNPWLDAGPTFCSSDAWGELAGPSHHDQRVLRTPRRERGGWVSSRQWSMTTGGACRNKVQTS